jgi:hypothetical protein
MRNATNAAKSAAKADIMYVVLYYEDTGELVIQVNFKTLYVVTIRIAQADSNGDAEGREHRVHRVKVSTVLYLDGCARPGGCVIEAPSLSKAVSDATRLLEATAAYCKVELPESLRRAFQPGPPLQAEEGAHNGG